MVIAWIVAGVVLVAVELHHFALYALFVAVGCLAAAVVAVVASDAVVVQSLAAAAVTLVGLVAVRPRVSGVLQRRGTHRARGVHGGFVGHEVLTLDRVGGPGEVGHVALAGERWLAISGADVTLPAGTRVLITGVEGTSLIVWPADGLLPIEEVAAVDNDPLAAEGEGT